MNCKKCDFELRIEDLVCPQCGHLNYATLVEQAKQGNDYAIEVLYSNVNRKNYYIALNQVKNTGVAEDIVQESIINSYKKLYQLKDPEKFDSWFTKIVHNRCTNYNDAKKNNSIHIFSDVESDDDFSIEENISVEEGSFVPASNVNYDTLKNGLREVMDELPEKQRLAITYKFLNEYSIKEIAEIMEIPENTVKSCIFQAKKKIKRKIEVLRAQNKSFYSVAAIPFLAWMLADDANAMELPVFKMPGAVAGVSASAAGAVSKGFLHTAAGKIATGCLCAVMAGTGVTGVVHHFSAFEQETAKEEWKDLKKDDFEKLIINEMDYEDTEYVLFHIANAMHYRSIDFMTHVDVSNLDIARYDRNKEESDAFYAELMDSMLIGPENKELYTNRLMLDEFQDKHIYRDISQDYHNGDAGLFSIEETNRYLEVMMDNHLIDEGSRDFYNISYYNEEDGSFGYDMNHQILKMDDVKIVSSKQKEDALRIDFDLLPKDGTYSMGSMRYPSASYPMRAYFKPNKDGKFVIDSVALRDKEEEKKKSEKVSKDYIFPTSDSEYLTKDDLKGKSLKELNYGRNEIFARHGRRFRSAELQSYFDSKSWYEGLVDPDSFDHSVLNDFELKNIEFLKNAEYEKNPNGYVLDAETKSSGDSFKDSCVAFIQSQAGNYSSYFTLDMDGDGVKELFLHRVESFGEGNYEKFGDMHYYDVHVYSGGSWSMNTSVQLQGALLVTGAGQGFYVSGPMSTNRAGITHYVKQGGSISSYFVGETMGSDVLQEAVDILNACVNPTEYNMNDYSGI